MKELTRVDRNGYITSGLDLTVRARTIQGEIVAFTVEPEGTSAVVAGDKVELEPIIASVDRIVDLLGILKNCGLILEDNKIKMVNENMDYFINNIKNVSFAAYKSEACPANASPCTEYTCNANICGGNASPCVADGCDAVGCGANVSPCVGHGCTADGCGANTSPCVADGCSGNTCGGNATPCAADGCGGNTCGGNAAPCAADGCAGQACGANAAPCAAQGCAAQACAIEVMPCAADGHIGPCIHIPYCPIIL